MDRSRSYSRHRPVPNINHPRSPSPSTPRLSTSSTSSRGRPLSRPPPSHRGARSRSASTSGSLSPTRRQHHHHQQRHHEASSHHEHHHGGLLKTSAGLIAGIGLATVLVHKVWPKDEDDSSSSGSRSKHHHHHHHHERHHQHHHRRGSDASSSNAERILDRARSTHGNDVLYVEETGPFSREDARRMSLDPRPLERLSRQNLNSGHSSRPLPYPETPYPGEKFYEPRSMRASFSEPIPVSR